MVDLRGMKVPGNMRIETAYRMAGGGIVLVYDNSANNDPKPVGLLMVDSNGARCQNTAELNRKRALRAANQMAVSMSVGWPVTLGRPLNECLGELARLIRSEVGIGDATADREGKGPSQ